MKSVYGTPNDATGATAATDARSKRLGPGTVEEIRCSRNRS
jgi:hypothetical protein